MVELEISDFETLRDNAGFDIAAVFYGKKSRILLIFEIYIFTTLNNPIKSSKTHNGY